MKKLMKHIIFASIFAGIAWIVILENGTASAPTTPGILYFAASIPFGWHLCSKVITAVSFSGILMKLAGAAIVGCFAMPVVLAMDLIGVIREVTAPRKAAA